ncbi:hypothetical protein J3Q64DRAFT_1719893 [Phycomyces blakesleeanus]|uniref:Uncharacterized protein n=1 Tax=Phycomyces blakesleeanus TaxID=4837 RepID=A0ABR3B981_PHYBL
MYDKAMKLSPDAPERANLIFPTTPRSSRPNSGQQNTSNNSSPLKDKNLLTIPKKRDHSKDENYGKQGLMGSVRRRSDQPGYSNGNERQKSSKKIEERVDPKKSASTKSSLGGIKATKESREVSTRSVSPASMPKQSKPSKLKSTALTSTKISEPKLETPTLTPTPTPTLTLTPTPAQSSIILSPSPTKLTVSENLHLKSSSKISAKIPIPTKTPGNTPTPTKVITPTKFTEFTKTLPSQKIPMSSKMASPVKELVKVPSKKPAKLSVRAPTPPSKNQVSQSPSIVPTLTPSAVPLPMATNVTPPQPSNTTTTPRYSSKSVVGWEKPPNEDTSNYDVSSNCFPQPYRAPIVNSQTQFSKLCLEHKKAQEEVKLLNETIDEQCPIIHEMLTKSSVEVGPKDDVIVKLKAVFLDLEGHPEDWRYVVYIVKRLFWLRQKLELLYSIITTAHGLQGYIIPEDV